jgi:hypothetical protein
MPVWGSFVLSALTITITTMVNLLIKFAPDAKTARKELVGLALTLIQWSLIPLNLVVLVLDVNSKEPLSRLVVAEIACEVGAIFFVLLVMLMRKLVALLRNQFSLIKLHAQAIKTLTDAVKPDQP